MIKLLLVDDDLQAIEGIAANIKWSSLGIEKCFCATGAGEAKQLILQENISIVIADIEMPGESGLELVEWINDNTQNTVCIFLTSYGDFEYTSKALRLRTSDYLLKPAPYAQIEDAVRRAVSQLGQLHQRELSTRHAMYWNDSIPALKEQFWYEVICGRMPQDEGYIARQAQRRHIPYNSKPSRLILYELPDVASLHWEQDLVDVAMKNILAEVFEHPFRSPIVMHFSGSTYFVLVDVSFEEEMLPFMCQGTVNVLESLFSGTVLCVIGRPAEPQQLREQALQLLQARGGENPHGFCCVHGDRGSTFHQEMAGWIDALGEGLYPQVLGSIREYLRHTKLHQSQLQQLRRSLSWKLYQTVSQKHMDMARIFAEERMMELSDRAVRSTEGLLQWLEWMLRRITEEDPEVKNTAVAQIQSYIREHHSEDLNRESLAAVTFLSVDYISHLFTQQTGQCLSEYIISVRMDKAKQLLRTTNLSVAQVAIGVGYNNISYFSRLFKRETGMTPQKYRKNNTVK